MIATHPSVEGSLKVARCGDSGVIDTLLSPEAPSIVDVADKLNANERKQDNNMGVGEAHEVRFCLSSCTDARGEPMIRNRKD